MLDVRSETTSASNRKTLKEGEARAREKVNFTLQSEPVSTMAYYRIPVSIPGSFHPLTGEDVYFRSLIGRTCRHYSASHRQNHAKRSFRKRIKFAT